MTLRCPFPFGINTGEVVDKLRVNHSHQIGNTHYRDSDNWYITIGAKIL